MDWVCAACWPVGVRLLAMHLLCWARGGNALLFLTTLTKLCSQGAAAGAQLARLSVCRLCELRLLCAHNVMKSERGGCCMQHVWYVCCQSALLGFYQCG